MNEKSILNKVKTLLKMPVALETEALENGTTIEAESFEAGSEVFIVSEEDRIPLPVGEYILSDGRSLVVEAEGVIASIGEAAESTEEVEETAEAEEMTEVAMTSENVREIVLSILEEYGVSKQELSEVKETVEEVVEETPEVKEIELSEEQPAAETIKPNPEAEVKQKFTHQFAKNRKQSTADLVMQKIAKLKN